MILWFIPNLLAINFKNYIKISVSYLYADFLLFSATFAVRLEPRESTRMGKWLVAELPRV